LVGLIDLTLETDSEKFVENWVSSLKFKQKTLDQIDTEETNTELGDEVETLEWEFTDVVIIGGDGLFSQYINSWYRHHFFNTLIKIPIWVLPGGTSNALAWDLGGLEPLNTWVNILRGNIIKGDIFKVDFEESGRSVLATVMAWGFVSELVKASENWRNWLGTSRYTLCGAKEMFCAGGAWNTRSHHINKAQFSEDVPFSVSKRISTNSMFHFEGETKVTQLLNYTIANAFA
jgi:diacylglycerol kinase family enzyme